ncbi:hypothetical protein [Pseudonocardia sp. N23]|uniref:hypothetical protein n=1 Tax=Pseudonocardia sp. N23 TaxID=1987376 RepID=UPI000BFE408A|nr:hypothetical protein [Pseudonocardia sp. N23]GAY07314.1 hypothetical protein TOK_2539 [Pseudonocardia sp. N23]
MFSTLSPTAAIVVDDSGIRIGTVDDDGQIRDFAGVHIGVVPPGRGDTAVDFAGIRLGHVVHGRG